jgi:hypothetical protein
MGAPITTSETNSAPNGCADSSQLDLWLPAMSTSATSETSHRRTSRATRNAISSPALAFGRSHSDGPDGKIAEKSGPDPAHASLSARQAAALGLVTTDISGQRGSGSSASARLSRLLASKYQDRTARRGSMLYRAIWKHCATPAGRWLSHQQVSARRISGTDCIGSLGGWPTPKVSDGNGLRPVETSSHLGGGPRANLNDMAMRAGWPTPTAKDADSAGNRKDQPLCLSLTDAARKAGWATPHASDHRPGHASRMHDTSRINLNDQAMLAGWSTPKAEDAESTGFSAKRLASGKTPDNLHSQTKMLLSGWPTPTSFDSVESCGGRRKNGERNGGGNCPSLRHLAADLAGWATPIQADARGSPGRKKHSELSQQATLAGWSTPASRDYRTPNHQTYADRGGGAKGEQLNNQVAHLIPGASLNGLPAATESCGLLNPAFSLWLQGVPATWLSCVPPATRSTRTSRQKSSQAGSPAMNGATE